MGNVWEKSNKTREQVLQDIEKTNKITKTDIFKNFTGTKLKFELKDELFQRINSKNIIELNIASYKNNTFLYNKTVYLDLDEFYNFFESLINSTHIFFEEKKYIEKKTNTQDSICPICNDIKVDTMLNCCHFFCNDCIKTWLLKKRNCCPLCRYQVKIDKTKGEIESNDWDVIDDYDENECNNEFRDRLKRVYNQIINKNI